MDTDFFFFQQPLYNNLFPFPGKAGLQKFLFDIQKDLMGVSSG